MSARTEQIDITTQMCPMTFVRTRLALDRLAPGDFLVIRLRGAEPRHSVPASAAALGHKVLELHDQPDGCTVITLQKA